MKLKTLMERKYNPAWGSHIPVLLKMLEITSGPVLELGVGPFSTPILNTVCTSSERKLVSYEDDPEFYTMHKSFNGPFHDVYFVEDWDKIDIENIDWGFVFIDHKPKRRKTEAKRMVNKKYVVVHDSEGAQDYHYDYRKEVFPLFKYRYTFGKLRPHTSVLSNFINLDNFKI